MSYAVRRNVSSSTGIQEPCHTFLGNIYRPGLMHGEAMVDSRLRVQDFQTRILTSDGADFVGILKSESRYN